jgi:hypothetical protein
MPGIVIQSTGTCTDRTLPMRNPLWEPSFLGSRLKVHLDGQLGKTVNGSNQLTAWADQAQGLNFALETGDGALNTYSFNGITVPRFTLDGYRSTAVVDTVAAHRLTWFVVDVQNAPGTQENLAQADNLSVYRTTSGAVRIFGPHSQADRGTLAAGKSIVVAYTENGTIYRTRINGVQGGSDITAGISTKTLGQLRIGRFDPGAIDTAFASFGIGSGTVSLLEVQKLEGFLAHRYGMTGSLPADHPFKTNAPRKLD